MTSSWKLDDFDGRVTHQIHHAMEAAVRQVYGFIPTAIPTKEWEECQDSMTAAVAKFKAQLNDPAVLQVVAEQQTEGLGGDSI